MKPAENLTSPDAASTPAVYCPGSGAELDHGAYRPVTLPIAGSLTDLVSALVAVDVGAGVAQPLCVAPHESMVLALQLGRGSDGIERKGTPGMNTRLTGIRLWPGTFRPGGDCVTVFALLTPLWRRQAARRPAAQCHASHPRERGRVAG